MRAFALLAIAAAFLHKGEDAGAGTGQEATAATVAKVQAQVESLASFAGAVCEAMCKTVQSFPSCAACPGFALPPPPPAAMDFDQLLEWMRNTGNKWNDELNALKRDAMK